jgi:hypothetical protein
VSPFFQRFLEARAEALLESLCGSADRGVDDLLHVDCVGLADLCGNLDDSSSFKGSDGREEFFAYTQPIRRNQRIARDTYDSRIYAGSRGASVVGACAYCTLFTLFLWTTVVLVALVATAGPPDPTLFAFCGDTTSGVCSQPDFIAGGLKSGTSYVIEGVGSTGEVFDYSFTATTGTRSTNCWRRTS